MHRESEPFVIAGVPEVTVLADAEFPDEIVTVHCGQFVDTRPDESTTLADVYSC